MKAILPLLLLTCASLAQAATYECTDRQGRRTYTNTSVAGQNCRAIDLGRPSVYSSAAPKANSHINPAPTAAEQGTTAPVPLTETAPAVVDSAQLNAAENRLNQARQNLEQGRQVRYGNERNYARYLERIQGLENEVKAAETALNALKQPQK